MDSGTGRRVRSGYIFVTDSENCKGNGTGHEQAYNKILTDVSKQRGILMFGFSQLNNTLQVKILRSYLT